MKPAEALEGLTLDEGWFVKSKIVPAPQATGGHFSVGYLVVNPSGEEAYLKALDFYAAFQDPDLPRALERMTSAYNFERDVLEKCKDRKMRRVVTPIADGIIKLPQFEPLGTVCYLIFEMAEGDARSQIAKTADIDLAWCLRSLHHISVGLLQLHQSFIAHQDLKPSNVLVFGKKGSKVADLGRASDIGLKAPHDMYSIPGDTTYAPFEQRYRKTAPGDFASRQAADMYLLGNMIFFFFANCSASQAVTAKLSLIPNLNWSGVDFTQDLPLYKLAFAEVIRDFRNDILPVAKGLTDEITQIVSELCEPDPAERGDRKNFKRATSQYNLERYVTRFNVLAKRLEVGKS
jgi:serine/threonine protein kinase